MPPQTLHVNEATTQKMLQLRIYVIYYLHNGKTSSCSMKVNTMFSWHRCFHLGSRTLCTSLQEHPFYHRYRQPTRNYSSAKFSRLRPRNGSHPPSLSHFELSRYYWLFFGKRESHKLGSFHESWRRNDHWSFWACRCRFNQEVCVSALSPEDRDVLCDRTGMVSF